MSSPHAFIVTLIALDVCASVAYALDSDWRRSVYWAAAATLTYVVTF